MQVVGCPRFPKPTHPERTVMSKPEFKCRLCGSVEKPGFFGPNPTKYVCPKHKEICRDHIDQYGGMTKCKACSKTVIIWEFNDGRERWEKA